MEVKQTIKLDNNKPGKVWQKITDNIYMEISNKPTGDSDADQQQNPDLYISSNKCSDEFIKNESIGHIKAAKLEGNISLRTPDKLTSELCKIISVELQNKVAPILASRYGNRKNMTILELGPAETISVPEALNKHGNHYIGMDLYFEELKYQNKFLKEDGCDNNSYQVNGNTYFLPFKNETVDLIVTSCHQPIHHYDTTTMYKQEMLSHRDKNDDDGLPQAKKMAIDEIARVLKKGGELVISPWIYKDNSETVINFYRNHFDAVENWGPSQSQSWEERHVLILKKKVTG